MRIRKSLLWSLLALWACAATADPFASSPMWSSGTTESGGDGIARFIDFDGDGDLDFVTAAPDPKRWVIYENVDGSLAKSPYWESEETSDLDHIDVIDFDRDGWPDLAATHETHCTLYFNRQGRFATRPDWETDIITNANQIDFADYDGDGDLDMLMASGAPINGIALFENTEGRPSRTPTMKLGHAEYSEAAIFADYFDDGDSKLDVVAHYPSGKTVVYRNRNNSFEDASIVYDDSSNPWTQRHYLFDLDGDGQTELFSAKGPWGNNGISLQLTKQRKPELGGRLKARWQSAPDTMIHAFEFDDVDGDGDVDVVASDYAHNGRVYIYLNTGGKLAEEPDQTIAATGPVHEAVLGDIDLDGDLDLAVGGRDQAHVFENLTISED